jgi:hypothetical protein
MTTPPLKTTSETGIGAVIPSRSSPGRSQLQANMEYMNYR